MHFVGSRRASLFVDCLIFALLYDLGRAQTVCNNKANLLNIAYARCKTSTTCMDSFYLTADEEVWERPRFDYLLLKITTQVGSNVTTICSSETVFIEWFSVVAEWNFCRRNEIFSLIEGICICRSGRNCELSIDSTDGYSTRDLVVLVVLLLLGGAYAYAVVLKKVHTLSKEEFPLTAPTPVQSSNNPNGGTVFTVKT